MRLALGHWKGRKNKLSLPMIIYCIVGWAEWGENSFYTLLLDTFIPKVSENYKTGANGTEISREIFQKIRKVLNFQWANHSTDNSWNSGREMKWNCYFRKMLAYLMRSHCPLRKFWKMLFHSSSWEFHLFKGKCPFLKLGWLGQYCRRAAKLSISKLLL